MSDSSNNSPAIPPHQKPAKSRRWVIWLLPFVGVAIPAGIIAWSYFGPAAAIRISKETTYLLEPVGPDGYIDYEAHIQKRHAEIGGKVYTDDRWGELVRGLIVRNYLPGSSIAGQPEVDSDEELLALTVAWSDSRTLRRRPWTADEHPLLADAIHKSERWFDVAQETMEPVVPYGAREVIWESNNIAESFQVRAMLNFGTGKNKLAIDDVLFLIKMSRRKAVLLHHCWHCRGLETRAMRSLFAGVLAAKEFDFNLLNELKHEPETQLPDLLEGPLEMFRCQELDRLTQMHAGGTVIPELFYNSPRLNALASRRLYSNLDWNKALTLENEFHDAVIEAVQADDWGTIGGQLGKLCESPEAFAARSRVLATLLSDDPVSTNQFMIARQREYNVHNAVTFTVATKLTRRVTFIAIRLAAWRNQHGEFPETLDQLNTLQQFQDWPSLELIDPFSGAPIEYSRVGTGFELRSVGVDGERDSATHYFMEDDSYAFSAKRINLDVVWRWPIRDEAEINE